MMIATFPDGSRCRLGVVRGEGFDPKDGDVFLFELPEGQLKEGAVRVAQPAELEEDGRVCDGVYDAESRTVSLVI